MMLPRNFSSTLAVFIPRLLISPKPQDTTIATDEAGHPFLKYTSANIILHTKGFRKERSVTWNHWTMIISEGNDLLQYPWGSGPFRENDPAVLKWCFSHSYLGLIRVIYRHRGVARTKEQNDSLFRAVEASNLDLAETLMASGSDPNAVSDEGRSAIGMAAGAGSLDVVNKLLLAGADVNRPEADIVPALHLAAQPGNTDIVNRLIAVGAIVNMALLGRSALHVAGERGHLEVVEALLAAGADFMIDQYGVGRTLDLAATCGHPGALEDTALAYEMVSTLNDNQTCDKIYTALTNGHPDIAYRIIEIRTMDYSRSTSNKILCLAARCGPLGVVEYVLAYGADPNASVAGWGDHLTPLETAVKLDRRDMVDALLAAGARIDTFEHGPEMILQIAAKHGSPKILEKALAAGADVNAVLDEDESYTALHIAAKWGALRVLKRLMEENIRSRSALHSDHDNDIDLVAERAFLIVINMLLAAGADVDRRTYRGQTQLQIAAKHWVSLLSGVRGQNKSRLTTDEGRQALEAALRGYRAT